MTDTIYMAEKPITDFGNGILYFHSNGEQFGKQLSQYLTDNPEIHIVSISASVSYGGTNLTRTDGYFAVVERKVKT